MRIATFAFSGSLSHAARVAALARGLLGSGILGPQGALRVFGAPGWFAHPALGVTEVLHPHPEPPVDEVLRGARGLLPLRPESEILREAFVQDRRALAEFGADFVIADHRRSALLAAESLNIPSLSLTGASVLGPHLALRPTPAQFGRLFRPVLGLPPLPSVPEIPEPSPLRLSTDWVSFLAEHALRPRTFLHELSFGDHTFVLDDPTLFPTRGLPPSVTVLGAVEPDLDLPSLDLLSLVSGTHSAIDAQSPTAAQLPRPLVWLSMGSTGDAALARPLALGLAKRGITVLWSGAEGTLPPGVFALPSLVSAEPLLDEVDLLLSNGGSALSALALRRGVPVLAFPDHLDQALAAAALEQAGAGRAMPARIARIEPIAALGLATFLLSTPRPIPRPGPGYPQRVLPSLVDATLSLLPSAVRS